MRKLFGTDGIRGIANKYPLTTGVCLNLAKVLAERFCSAGGGAVLIGKDTRISGDMLEHALAAAFASLGITAKLIGVCPTPAISILTKNLDTDFGIMISASHNPFSDNGIKIFDKHGLKLTDAEEEEIERSLENLNDMRADCDKIIGDKLGRVLYCPNALDLYIEKIKNSFSFDKDAVRKMKIVIDSSNGSFSKIAPKIFQDFGFDIISICDSPNGININDGCGVTNPDVISHATIDNKADIGIAFDGDGDRLLLCDETGKFFDGDHVLAIFAETQNLKNAEIVSTIMLNFGFEQYLKRKKIALTRTQVGDRYISECMRRSSRALFGGEPSGHIIIREHALTGDGLFAALKTLDCVLKSNKKLGELYDIFKPYPAVSRNVKISDKNVISVPTVVEKIRRYERQLTGRGKLIVRSSGTEPLIRIFAEGEDEEELDAIVSDLAHAIENA